jgi:hypothetical protein
MPPEQLHRYELGGEPPADEHDGRNGVYELKPAWQESAK